MRCIEKSWGNKNKIWNESGNLYKTSAKESKEVKIKAQELVDLAKEKGTPIVQKTAKDVKAKTSELLRSAAAKLDEKPAAKKTAKKATK